MASYDYRCRTCEDTFEVRRSITDPETSARCPAGHAEVSRVWSAVALAGLGAPSPSPGPATTGGCCGGGGCRG